MLPFIDLAKQQKKIRKHIFRGIKNVLNHGQYVMGEEVSILEEKLAEYVGVKHCICTSSGTDALLIALMAQGIQQGDEVITTAFTFIATAEVIVRVGAKPIFVDIDPNTYNIDTTKIESSITPKTKAIIGVSLFGQCPDFDAIQQICQKHELVLIEDAAQSFGAEYKGKKSCSIVETSCTSFFPAKPLGGYGDGGACFTNNDSIALALREIINHGQNFKYQYLRHGINGRLDTLQAAILIEKLKIFPDEVLKRREIAERYDNLLKNFVKIPFIPNYNKSVYAQYTIQTDDQKALQNMLRKRGIPSVIYYPDPLHLQPIFINKKNKELRLKNVEYTCKKVLSIPIHPYLTKKKQHQIIRSIIECVE